MSNQKPKIMKKILLISLAFMIGLAVVAQQAQLKKGIYVQKYKKELKVTNEPVEKNTMAPVKANPLGLKNGDNTNNIVTILTLGTSTNTLGYSGGTRTMVWADDDLNVVTNFHRMGPGATPPSYSGYLGMDLGVNMGATQADWTPQIQVHAAQIPTPPGGTYYSDASRYPSAGVYNPAGNTTLANAYLGYFAPNFCNNISTPQTFGGYSYGRANLVNHADTIKHLRWYNPPPFTYTPDGFTIGKNGIAHMVDCDDSVGSSLVYYQDSVIYGRGVWNGTSKDFDYTFQQVAFPCVEMASCADAKIAASITGDTVWMSTLTNLVGANPIHDSIYFPALRRSIDGGLTWGDAIPVEICGPNGIAAVKNQWSDNIIATIFADPVPSRDEIVYTTAFDHSLSVDKWGNPHIGVVVGYSEGGYSIISSFTPAIDSTLNVFDIYSIDGGASFQGVWLGTLKNFRGTWNDISADNRVYVSTNKNRDKMFFTWNDTYIDGQTDNANPDVIARGFDLVKKMITSDQDLANAPNNVTFLSDITNECYMQCTAPFVFTDNDKYTIPICTQYWTDPAGSTTFKYIPDFSYVDGNFTIPVNNPGVGVDQKNNEIASVSVYPNPVKDIAKVSLTLKQNANVSVSVTNLVGQQVMSLNKGNLNAGSQQFSIDAHNLTAGVYFISVNVNGQKYTQKMIVE
jgi:hypothetical protein